MLPRAALCCPVLPEAALHGADARGRCQKELGCCALFPLVPSLLNLSLSRCGFSGPYATTPSISPATISPARSACALSCSCPPSSISTSCAVAFLIRSCTRAPFSQPTTPIHQSTSENGCCIGHVGLGLAQLVCLPPYPSQQYDRSFRLRSRYRWAAYHINLSVRLPESPHHLPKRSSSTSTSTSTWIHGSIVLCCVHYCRQCTSYQGTPTVYQC